MPKLNDLGKKERTEICRTLARAAHDCLANSKDADGCILGGTFDARVFKSWSELGVVEDDEFYGNAFSKERIEVLKGFEETYGIATQTAKIYDECVAPLADLPPENFAMKSEVLVRMSCISRFSATLLGDGPFANLHVTLCVAEDDDDRQSIANGEEEAATSSDDGDESDDSIVASSSEENDDSDDSGSEEEEDEEEEKTSDIEEVTPEEAEPVDGPRRKKVRVHKVEDASESEADVGSADEDD